MPTTEGPENITGSFCLVYLLPIWERTGPTQGKEKRKEPKEKRNIFILDKIINQLFLL